jgi:hypothetical protein
LVFSLISLLLVAGGIGAGIFLISQRQETRVKAAPATKLSLLPTQKAVSPGETFTLSVNVDTRENTLVGVELHLSYNPEVLTVGTINQGTFFNQVQDIQKSTSPPGTITYIFIAPLDSQRQGQGTLATITFTANTNISGDTLTGVEFTPQTAASGLGEGGENIIVDTPAGSQITILGSESQTTNTPVPTNTPGPEPTNTPIPEATNTPVATNTSEPEPTITPLPETTSISTPTPTMTDTAGVTATPTSAPDAPVAGVLETTLALLAGAGILMVLGLLVLI